jgi:CubicO group peptidase (beta-lactamase class C family)
VRERYVKPKVDPLNLVRRVDYQQGQRVGVQTLLPGLAHARSAIYRRGLGCTLVPPDTTEAKVRAQGFTAAPSLPADARPWPLGEAAVETSRLDVATRDILARHAGVIFSEPSQEPKQGLNATALLVARDGHLLFEQYGQGFTREQPQLGWSMTKTLTALVAGLFARDGKLEVDAPVGLSRWNGTPKAKITWRQLLNMAPGLSWTEGYGGASDATEMLFSHADQGAWAADRPLTRAPGSYFNYSTGFTNVAMLALREKLGGDAQALYDLYQRELFAPLGIRGGVIEPDASGTPVGGARGLLRPVDWLRLGQLVGDRGHWNGTRVLPEAWIDFMTSPSPASAGYGGFLWRRESDMITPAQRAKLPADLVWFAGHMSQYIFVAPSQKLLVLRMGVSLEGSMEHDLARDQVLALVSELITAKAAR